MLVYKTLMGFLGNMNLRSKQFSAMQTGATATERLCANYWVESKFNSQHDPITNASLYKDSGQL